MYNLALKLFSASLQSFYCILYSNSNASGAMDARYEATYFISRDQGTPLHTNTSNTVTEHNPKPTFSVKKWKKVLYIIGLWLLLVLIALAMFIITRGWDFQILNLAQNSFDNWKHQTSTAKLEHSQAKAEPDGSEARQKL